MKANLAQREPEILRRWGELDVYGAIRAARAGSPSFVLHDGPPYANGHIHHGHVLNKILKDIVVKSKTMAGFDSPYLPGWDCHGLPIEHKVDQLLGEKKAGMSVGDVRRECRRYAEKYIGIQREEFRRLGVLGEWDEPYYTMSYDYEATIARQFAAFVRGAYVYTGKKPVHWDPVSRTALAEAEVEYHDHTSPSVYVAFPMKGDPARLDPALAGKEVRIVIWTTTPWTLPANMAIAFHPEFDYVAYEHGGAVYVFAEGLAFAVQGACGLEGGRVLARFKGRAVEGLKARHPWIERDSLLVLADYVTLEAGTGAVHTAPGHGADDFNTGLQYGIEIYSPVDDDGNFTSEVEHWAGLNVFEANRPIIDFMRERGCLLHQEEFIHSYPHGWRSKAPIIFRATEQWFVAVDHNGLRQRALELIGETEWFPSWGEERIAGMVAHRPDWCISRQRSWGVPIIAFYCEACGGVVLDADVIERVADIFELEGTDVWFDKPAKELLPPGLKCPGCGGAAFRKESDILDVWFDSGISHAAVLGRGYRPDLPWPSDLYLEGSDQHRGWFHSSLLCGIVGKGGAPYRQVLTHGFVVDAEGRAMSKSLGNIFDVQAYVSRNGAEILRLWVAMTDYRDDIKVSEEILARNAEAYRKLRNTCRFLLGNLFDFDPAADAVPADEMEEIDRYALAMFEVLRRRVVRAYERYEFHTVYHDLNRFATVDLSAFYLDILKDRLYCELPGDRLRRSSQSAMFRILDGLVRLMAPIVSFTADEIWERMPGWEGKEVSVHAALFPEPVEIRDDSLAERWVRLRQLRDVVLRALEGAREAKTIGQGLDARVVLEVPPAWGELVERYRGDLTQLFIVSQVETREGEEGKELQTEVGQAVGSKCERCWGWSPTVGGDPDHPSVCERCARVLRAIEEER